MMKTKMKMMVMNRRCCLSNNLHHQKKKKEKLVMFARHHHHHQQQQQQNHQNQIMMMNTPQTRFYTGSQGNMNSSISTTASQQQQQQQPPPAHQRTAILNSRLVIEDDDEISQKIQEYAMQSPTSISLLDLTTTYSHYNCVNETTTTKGAADPHHQNQNTHQKQQQYFRMNHRGRMGQKLIAERTMIKVAQLLWRELPIRLAQRIQDLEHVIIKDMTSVQQVKAIYRQSFCDLITIPEPTKPQLEKQFATLLQTLYKKHSNVLLLMAKGASEFRNQIIQQEYQIRTSHYSFAGTTSTSSSSSSSSSSDTCKEALAKQLFAEQEECHHFLNRFYFSRVGIRVLAGQYLALRQQLLMDQQQYHHHLQHQQFKFPADTTTINQHQQTSSNNSSSYIGMVNQHTSPYEIVQQAIANANRLCEIQYPGLDPPEVEISGQLDLTFCYIPTHLHYIMLELIKNAMRATMEYHHFNNNNGQGQGDDNVVIKPPINVIIADGMDNEDIVIKVSDEGGGIPRSQMDYIWSYLFTTADPQVQERFLQEQDTTTNNNNNKREKRQNRYSMSSSSNTNDSANIHNQGPVLAGLGYGLPMSRAYAQYFGGDLDLLSMEGYGTDAFVHLVRLGDKGPSL